MNIDRLCLSDSVNTISSLRLHGRVPPSPVVNDMIGFGNRQSDASHKGRENDDIETIRISEAFQHRVPRSPCLLAAQAPGVNASALLCGTIHDVRLYAKDEFNG